ncbi:Nramp family divalent metal transporter [Cyclobacterium sp. 1_MG-2023]|uniref:Nramp family divalent metal transporter n=1 Tax=Cyclobacterium sp. 1_MG-2023 TaxID=3062681 RepID=UPI0026E1BD15|nr:Nramp family divalent metal transporter [Cyclobacterium sp. 1_MG-2023]MDO6438715.1 Nramp family divalent metal transporter [Cyclobacterium sp. 1_MG-2023]
MEQESKTSGSNIFQKIWLWMLGIGPGIFCIGYTIGTGSVTSMAKAGSEFGMQLLWVLVLSCVFAWVLMEAYGRYAVVTGQTSIYSFKTKLKGGKLISFLVVGGIILAQWNSLSGILGLSANAIYEMVTLFFPGIGAGNGYWIILGIAIALILIMYALLWVGQYSFFEKVLVVFVTIMGVSFIISMFVVLPDPGEMAKGLIPSVPQVAGGKLLVAAFVGTTMAAPTFVVRPLLMKGKGWGPANTKDQSKDALTGAVLMLIINLSIMAAATGALHAEGKTIDKVMDMVYLLEPVAGKFAVALFMTGALSAGLSSVFPILMVAPLLVADYKEGELDTNSVRFKVLTGVACIVGLTVPILGANPIFAQILTQVAAVFVLPLVIACIMYLVNQKAMMGEHKAGLLLNIGLTAAFVFACIISYTGALALIELL